MGKYTSYKVKEPAMKRGELHPVMRGIGCILFAIVPPLAYGISVLLVNYGIGHRWPIPPSWLGTPSIHPLLLRLQGLRGFYDFIYNQTNLTANLIFTVALCVFIFGVMSMLYGFMFSLMGPPQYGPMDEPPIRKKVKRYKR
jgi:hypothetical protein